MFLHSKLDEDYVLLWEYILLTCGTFPPITRFHDLICNTRPLTVNILPAEWLPARNYLVRGAQCREPENEI